MLLHYTVCRAKYSTYIIEFGWSRRKWLIYRCSISWPTVPVLPGQSQFGILSPGIPNVVFGTPKCPGLASDFPNMTELNPSNKLHCFVWPFLVSVYSDTNNNSPQSETMKSMLITVASTPGRPGAGFPRVMGLGGWRTSISISGTPSSKKTHSERFKKRFSTLIQSLNMQTKHSLASTITHIFSLWSHG